MLAMVRPVLFVVSFFDNTCFAGCAWGSATRLGLATGSSSSSSFSLVQASAATSDERDVGDACVFMATGRRPSVFHSSSERATAERQQRRERVKKKNGAMQNGVMRRRRRWRRRRRQMTFQSADSSIDSSGVTSDGRRPIDSIPETFSTFCSTPSNCLKSVTVLRRANSC